MEARPDILAETPRRIALPVPTPIFAPYSKHPICTHAKQMSFKLTVLLLLHCKFGSRAECTPPGHVNDCVSPTSFQEHSLTSPMTRHYSPARFEAGKLMSELIEEAQPEPRNSERFRRSEIMRSGAKVTSMVEGPGFRTERCSSGDTASLPSSKASAKLSSKGRQATKRHLEPVEAESGYLCSITCLIARAPEKNRSMPCRAPS